MHLINAHTIQLEHFTSETDVDYVTLSHRWETEEVSFEEFQAGEDIEEKKGYAKILACCAETRRRGYSYAWIDTCCIDKTNSTELSEAINSMYRWYQNAKECYAYLSDVGRHEQGFRDQFYSSEWFERGWTLQELIAPRNVYFYDKAWHELGSKKDLVKEVSRATGIMEGALTGKDLQTFSIAERMCWAAHRKTTRIEDRAYSLMGLFNVHMPMLYGEGERAFLRLQQEIIQRSCDDSIFAWSGVPEQGSGLLAPRLDCFASSPALVGRLKAKSRGAYNMSNRGLNITLSLTPWTSDTYLAMLNCKCPDRGKVGIFLRWLYGSQYRRARIANDNDMIVDTHPLRTEKFREYKILNIYVQQDEFHSRIARTISVPPLPIYGIQLTSSSSPDWTTYGSFRGLWEPETRIARLYPGQFGAIARFDLTQIHSWFKSWMIKIGLTFDFRPVCEIERTSNPNIWQKIVGGENSYVGNSERVTHVPADFNVKLFTFKLEDGANRASFRIHLWKPINRTLCKIEFSSTFIASRPIWVINIRFDQLELGSIRRLLS